MASEAQKAGSDGDVSNCVSNLVHAFTDGLNIFKRLRERRRKRKSKKNQEKREKDEGAELQLSNSLRKGPMDIQKRYEKCYGEKGDRFAKGDSIAHASLAETLVKLNTGLVGIIAAFLNHDSKHKHLDLDYKSLTSLSDASRKEAMESMNQLYMRLSQSQMQVHRMATPKPDPEKRKHTGSRQKVTGPTVTRVPGKSSNETQLVFMRPKNGRKGSTSSGSSTRATSTTRSSPLDTPSVSPLPQYSAKDPYPFAPLKPTTTKVHAHAGRRRAESCDGPRPTTWLHPKPDDTTPMSLRLPPPKATATRKSPPPREKRTSPPLSPSATPIKRRMDKETPSTYTFLSDSTKLGEIPQRNWTIPWDYEEAERLNAEAAVVGLPAMVAGGERTKKKGLFRFLRRGSAQA